MNWKHYNIFVSSTFQDMDRERDYLKSLVLSQLNEMLLPYNTSVSLVDLRSSVETDPHQSMEEREKMIFKYCIDKIEECRPFFIGFVGHRWGWVPNESYFKEIVGDSYNDIPRDFPFYPGDISVTAFEFIKGFLNHPQDVHALIYLRDECSYDSLSEETKHLYIEKEELPAVNAFRDYLNSVTRCKPYTLHLGHLSQKDVQDWGEMIVQDIFHEVITSEKKRESPLLSFYRRQKSREELFLNKKTQGFCGRDDLMSEIFEKMAEYSGCIISAEELGMGRTSVLCEFARRASRQLGIKPLYSFPEIMCLYPGLDTEHSLLLYWLLELSGTDKIIEDDVVNSPDQIEVLFDQYASSNELHLLFVLDDRNISGDLRFDKSPLSLNRLSEYGAIITSSVSLDGVMSGGPYLALGKLGENECKKMLYGMRNPVAECLARKPKSYLPRYIREVQTILDTLSIKDYTIIRSGKDKDSEQEIINYCCSLINSIPDSLEEIPRFDYSHLRSVFGESFTDKITAAFALFRGLSDEDISAITGHSSFWVISFRENCTYDLRSVGGLWLINDSRVSLGLIEEVPKEIINEVVSKAYVYFQTLPEQSPVRQRNLLLASAYVGEFNVIVELMRKENYEIGQKETELSSCLSEFSYFFPEKIFALIENICSACKDVEDLMRVMSALGVIRGDFQKRHQYLDILQSAACHFAGPKALFIQVMAEACHAELYEKDGIIKKATASRERIVEMTKGCLDNRDLSHAYISSVVVLSRQIGSPAAQLKYIQDNVIKMYEQAGYPNADNIGIAYNYCSIYCKQNGGSFEEISTFMKKAIEYEIEAMSAIQNEEHYLVSPYDFRNIQKALKNFYNLCEQYNAPINDAISYVEKVVCLIDRAEIDKHMDLGAILDIYNLQATYMIDKSPSKGLRLLENLALKEVTMFDFQHANPAFHYYWGVKHLSDQGEEGTKRWFYTCYLITKLLYNHPDVGKFSILEGRNVVDVIRIFIAADALCPFPKIREGNLGIISGYAQLYPNVNLHYKEADVVEDIKKGDLYRCMFLIGSPLDSMEDSLQYFYLALAFMRIGDFGIASSFYDKLYEFSDLSEGFLLSIKVNDLISSLASLDFNRAQKIYSSMTDEEKEDSDVVDLVRRHKRYIEENLDAVPLAEPLGYCR